MMKGWWKIVIDGKLTTDWLAQRVRFRTAEDAWNYVEEMQENGSVDPDTQHIEVCYYRRDDNDTRRKN